MGIFGKTKNGVGFILYFSCQIKKPAETILPLVTGESILCVIYKVSKWKPAINLSKIEKVETK